MKCVASCPSVQWCQVGTSATYCQITRTECIVTCFLIWSRHQRGALICAVLCQVVFGQTLHVYLRTSPNSTSRPVKGHNCGNKTAGRQEDSTPRQQSDPFPTCHQFKPQTTATPPAHSQFSVMHFAHPISILLVCLFCPDQIIPKMHRSMHSARRAAPFSLCANTTFSKRAFSPSRAVRCKASSESTNTAAKEGQHLVDRRQLLHSAAGLALALQAAQLSPAEAAGLTLEDVTPTTAAAGRTGVLVATHRAAAGQDSVVAVR